jgi:ABC-type branched-subunit amino acid transport system ATPase component
VPKLTFTIEDIEKNGVPTAKMGETSIDWQGLDPQGDSTMAFLMGVTIRRLWDSGTIAAMARVVCADLIAAGVRREQEKALERVEAEIERMAASEALRADIAVVPPTQGEPAPVHVS